MHPAGSLFEKPINIEETLRQHDGFKEALRRAGATVYDVREVLTLYVCVVVLRGRYIY